MNDNDHIKTMGAGPQNAVLLSGLLFKQKLELFDLKQLADHENDFKQECRAALRRYKSWLRRQAGQTDSIELYCGTIEGQVLHHHAQNYVRAYWTIRTNFRMAFQYYIEKSCAYPTLPFERQAA